MPVITPGNRTNIATGTAGATTTTTATTGNVTNPAGTTGNTGATTPTPPLPPVTVQSGVPIQLVKHEVLVSATPAEVARAEAALTAYSPVVVSRHQRQGHKAPDGSWPGCFLTTEQKPIPGGMELFVYSAHPVKNDSVKTQLQLKVQIEIGGRTTQQYITLEPQTAVVPNPTGCTGGFIGIQRFTIMEKDINAYLAANAPQAKGLRLVPGADIMVTQTWPTGHKWGGENRDGTVKFEMTGAAATGSQVSTSAGGEWVQDLAVPYDASLIAKYPALNVPNGAYQSHIEQESKARMPLSRAKAMFETLRIMSEPKNPAEVQQQQALMTKIVGDPAKWKLTPLHEFHKKDAAGNILYDKNGFPETKVFKDLCCDNENRDLANNRFLVRWRTVDGTAQGTDTLNIKLWEPTPLDRNGLPKVKPGNVNNRLETGSPMARGTSTNSAAQEALFADKKQPLNPINRMREMVPTLRIEEPGNDASQLRPSMQIVARRYKFDLANDTGFSVEKSLDVVIGLALDREGLPLRVDDNGKPDPNGKCYAISAFGNFEGELNHLNLQGTSTGTANAALWGRNAVGTPTAVASNVAVAQNGGQLGGGQEQWLAGLPATSKVSGTARIHSHTDMTDPRSKEGAEYKGFVDEEIRFQEGLLGRIGDANGAMPTEQKSAMASMLCGLIPMTAGQKQLFAEELAISAKLRKALPAVMDGPMQQAMTNYRAQETAIRARQQQLETAAKTNRTNTESYAKNALDQAEQRAKNDEAAAAAQAEPQRSQTLAAVQQRRTQAQAQYAQQMNAAALAYDTAANNARTQAETQLEAQRAAVREVAINVLQGVNALDYV
ncbi:MAG: hypothetical protein HYS27_07745 [Deltaproteobacteria bacterium]|nr:hypothetical protein [Deltaproteobacteria bacterium]